MHVAQCGLTVATNYIRPCVRKGLAGESDVSACGHHLQL